MQKRLILFLKEHENGSIVPDLVLYKDLLWKNDAFGCEPDRVGRFPSVQLFHWLDERRWHPVGCEQRLLHVGKLHSHHWRSQAPWFAVGLDFSSLYGDGRRSLVVDSTSLSYPLQRRIVETLAHCRSPLGDGLHQRQRRIICQ